MILHAYFTNGMFDNAKVFLESLLKTNGDKFDVLLSTRDLSIAQIMSLHSYYPKLEVENDILNMVELANRARIPVKRLQKYRRQIEKRFVTSENKVWKLLIAAEDRPRALHEVIARRGEDPIIHFDIDTLFRKDISPLAEMANQHDCCLLLRPKIRPIKARITISTMTWKRNAATMSFFDRWFHWLDFCKPNTRPIGYGQTSCWFAFEETREYLNYYTLPPQ